jgi:hypothetical protein
MNNALLIGSGAMRVPRENPYLVLSTLVGLGEITD